MKFDKAYFISWKPTAERLDLLQEGVKWARSKNLDPVIIAMEWDNYDRFTNMKWMKIDFQLPPGQARNLALNHFYSTDDDYCIILDDDTWIEKGDDVIDTIRGMNYPDVNVISILEHAHAHRFEESEDHIFRIPVIFASGSFIVKNNRRIFFNPEFRWQDGKLQYGEDVDFLAQAWYEELGGWECTTAITNQSRDRSNTPSTWWYEATVQTESRLTGLIQRKIRPARNKYEIVVKNRKITTSLGDVHPFRVRKGK